ncbi:MAG TPA: efflux RND transporter periplasmic adaptor subunit [Acidobacteriaceae bacterium]|nr:efflux RND transporter periplasmic adaptor subunit [Acidobacteriaceae bacterium]
MYRKRFVWTAAVLSLVPVACKSHPPATAPQAASVVPVTRGSVASSLTVAGQFEPYQEVELHAKVSGYIRWIKVDIGDRVSKGEVLATLEVPELEDQLQGSQAQVRHSQSEILRAKSEVASDEANYSALHSEFTRLSQAARQRPGLIAEQELDDARAKDQQAAAQVAVAKAALDAMQQQLSVSQADSHRVQTLANYQQIISPFNGVVTMRYADTGSLIQAGTSSNTQSMPVVQVAQSDLLRLRMPVPESDVPYIHEGGPVQIKVSATGQTFAGKIVRFARALDSSTRTMLTEVDVPNPKLTLSPGMYAEATIQLQQQPDALVLPAQAVVQNGTQSYVLVVDRDNHVERREVTLGIQTADKTQIASGLHEGEQVIASGQSSYQVGELVKPHAAFIPTAAEEASE